jgi:anaerobic selenocysteine-containing dehydrogenase
MESIVENDKVLAVNGRKDHPFTRGYLCSKVKRYDQRVYSDERIICPMRRIGAKGEGHFQRISWDEALDEISANFKESIIKYGAESILPCSYLGHQGLLNGLHCGDRFFNELGASIGERTFCNATASKAFQMVAGPTGGLDPESFSFSNLIIVWGMNPIATSIHHSHFILEAKKKGAILVVIDPIKTDTAKLADYHISPRPGTDVVLAMGIANILIKSSLVDMEYVSKHTQGFEEFSDRVGQFDCEFASQVTGVPEQSIKKLSSLIAEHKATAIRVGVGLERTENGGDAIRAIAALPALTGAWKVVGGGIFQNPQGTFPINRKALTNASLIEESRSVVNLYDIASALSPNVQNPIHCLFVYNSNPVIAAANQTKLIQNLCRSDLFVTVSEIFHTDTCAYADILLPAASQLEQKDLMYSWGHFNLQYNNQAIQPIGEAVSNTELFRRLARKMGLQNNGCDIEDDEIMRLALDWDHPHLDGINIDLLKEKGFSRLNVGSPKTRKPHINGRFATKSGKFEFASTDFNNGGAVLSLFRQGFEGNRKLQPIDPLPSYKAQKTPVGGFKLISPKHKHFLNSGYTNFNLKNGIANKQILMINSLDAVKQNIQQGEHLILYNDLGKIDVFADVTEDIIQGVVMVNHGYWMRHIDGKTVNALISNKPSKIGKGITVNDTIVFIKKPDQSQELE